MTMKEQKAGHQAPPAHLAVRGIHKRFGGVHALHGVDFEVERGEVMALVGDIARRLAMMNQSLDNPLHGDGIVLIDEVDLHLHPRWQRSLIRQLSRNASWSDDGRLARVEFSWEALA